MDDWKKEAMGRAEASGYRLEIVQQLLGSFVVLETIAPDLYDDSAARVVAVLKADEDRMLKARRQT
jgi:hypothetical protein